MGVRILDSYEGSGTTVSLDALPGSHNYMLYGITFAWRQDGTASRTDPELNSPARTFTKISELQVTGYYYEAFGNLSLTAGIYYLDNVVPSATPLSIYPGQYVGDGRFHFFVALSNAVYDTEYTAQSQIHPSTGPTVMTNPLQQQGATVFGGNIKVAYDLGSSRYEPLSESPQIGVTENFSFPDTEGSFYMHGNARGWLKRDTGTRWRYESCGRIYTTGYTDFTWLNLQTVINTARFDA